MEVNTYSTKTTFIRRAVDAFVEPCTEKRRVSIALSGGSTPLPIFDALAKKTPFDTNCQIDLFQVDERCVPCTDPASNQKMINEHLVLPLQRHGAADPIASATFFNTNLSPQRSAKQYAKILDNHIAQYGYSFDLCVLGIGTDGHTASLFPHTRSLRSKKLALHTKAAHVQIVDRVTISFRTIMMANKLLVLLQGKEKAPILNELLHGTKSIDEFPAKKLLEHQNCEIIFGRYA